MLLKDYLEENKISYREFAKSVGISAQYLCDLIKGRNLYIGEDLAKRINKKYPNVDILKIVTYKYQIRSDNNE